MPLHILKLAVGADDIEDVAAWQKRRQNARGNFQHRTRMTPTRAADIIPGGSMYWVIRGLIRLRQPIVAFHRKKDDSGRPYCIIELEPRHFEVEAIARRPFQGWRYLKAEDAPRDLPRGGAAVVDPKMPPELRQELRRLGLL